MTTSTKTPATPSVRADGLTKTYRSRLGSTPVLRGIDLEITGPGLTAVIGPSGSGKSTLLYCLSGLERATSGGTALLGTDLASARPGRIARLHRGAVGFVFQAFNLVPYLSAQRNAALPGLLARRRDAMRRAGRSLEALGMTDFARTPAGLLSGGQQQRVALARVLAQQARVIFADEPTGALDSATSQVVLGRLRRAAVEGAAVVLVTHDLEAAAAADRVVILRDGAIAADLGPTAPRDLASRMDDLAAAQSPSTPARGSAR
jgi:putative ABC transport system ATP-binding protein